MTIVVSSLTLCSGGNHVVVSGTINGVSGTVKLLKSDLTLDPDDRDVAIISRLRSAAKEAGATTNAQIQTAIVGKTFQV